MRLLTGSSLALLFFSSSLASLEALPTPQVAAEAEVNSSATSDSQEKVDDKSKKGGRKNDSRRSGSTTPGTETNEENSEPIPNLEYPLIPERALEILDFWFGYLPGPDFFPIEKVSLWFNKSRANAEKMRALFQKDVDKAAKGDYNQWRVTPRGRLALILLLDQIPRHLYLNKPQAFFLDGMARALAQEGIQEGADKKLYPIERAFFYLPLLHTEDPKIQTLSVDLYRQLYRESPKRIQPELEEFLRYAVYSQRQIENFGRFPDRNKILKRRSTEEEKKFLNTNSFSLKRT